MRSIPSYACAHKPQPLCPAKIRGNPNESDVTVKVIFFSSRFALLFRGKLCFFLSLWSIFHSCAFRAAWASRKDKIRLQKRFACDLPHHYTKQNGFISSLFVKKKKTYFVASFSFLYFRSTLLSKFVYFSFAPVSLCEKSSFGIAPSRPEYGLTVCCCFAPSCPRRSSAVQRSVLLCYGIVLSNVCYTLFNQLYDMQWHALLCYSAFLCSTVLLRC